MQTENSSTLQSWHRWQRVPNPCYFTKTCLYCLSSPPFSNFIIYLILRFNKTTTGSSTKNTDRNGINEHNTHTTHHTQRRKITLVRLSNSDNPEVFRSTPLFYQPHVPPFLRENSPLFLGNFWKLDPILQGGSTMLD